MRLFRVAVAVSREHGVEQFPMILLDADFHGLADEAAAERFTEEMIAALLKDTDAQVGACAVEV